MGVVVAFYGVGGTLDDGTGVSVSHEHDGRATRMKEELTIPAEVGSPAGLLVDGPASGLVHAYFETKPSDTKTK